MCDTTAYQELRMALTLAMYYGVQPGRSNHWAMIVSRKCLGVRASKVTARATCFVISEGTFQADS